MTTQDALYLTELFSYMSQSCCVCVLTWRGLVVCLSSLLS